MAGLNARYLIRQMEEYKNGNRDGLRADHHDRDRQGDHRRGDRAASEYYAKLKPHSRQKVVESETTPRSFVGGGGMRYAHAEGGTEPIGSRIILIPDTAEGAQRRNPKSNFVAYVPKGSIATARRSPRAAAARPSPAASATGRASRASARSPASPAKDPIYTFRQLYDMQQGRRKGDAMALMKAVVEKLTLDDMIALSAYAASLAAVAGNGRYPHRPAASGSYRWRPPGFGRPFAHVHFGKPGTHCSGTCARIRG